MTASSQSVAKNLIVDCPSGRLIEAGEIRLSEIISAMSVALDITQGQPQGHSMRSALIGMRLARQMELSTADKSALFYALLLKDVGCSSNAAKISYLFGADDHAVKHSLKTIDWTKPTVSIKHAWKYCSPGGTMVEKFKRIATMARSGEEGARQISEARCTRGSDIAGMLRLPESTSRAIFELDEHWNGRGFPCRLRGEEISLLARICCLSQTVEVFFTTYGLTAAINIAEERSGQWFDPQLVAALRAFRQEESFWDRLASEDLVAEISEDEPEDTVLLADDTCLDRVAEAFALVVDAKSPWTYKHSTRVSEISIGIAQQFNCPPALLQDLKRAALLHDIGKLGVSNLILDKPGKPTDEEFAQIRKHPDYSQQILRQVGAFDVLADVTAAHHERLDGRGYHRRLEGTQVHWVSRVLAVADICEALSAKRPYRDALPWEKIQSIMSRDSGPGIDRECFAALNRWFDRNGLESRVEDQLREVNRLCSEL